MYGNAVESSIWHYDNEEHKYNEVHYQLTSGETLYANWTRNSYELDLNAIYNNAKTLGLNWGDSPDFGTCDVYIYDDNDNMVESLSRKGVDDYCERIPYGYTYEIKNFNSNPGYVFCDNGSLKGTIQAKNNEAIIYIYDKYALAYYDGNGATGNDNIGTKFDYFTDYNVRSEDMDGTTVTMPNRFT